MEIKAKMYFLKTSPEPWERSVRKHCCFLHQHWLRHSVQSMGSNGAKGQGYILKWCNLLDCKPQVVQCNEKLGMKQLPFVPCSSRTHLVLPTGPVCLPPPLAGLPPPGGGKSTLLPLDFLLQLIGRGFLLRGTRLPAPSPASEAWPPACLASGYWRD